MFSSVSSVRALFILCVLFVYSSLSQADSKYELSQAQWSLPKTVESVLQMSAVKNTLSDFDKSPGSKLLILFPGGDEGTLWAHELKAWLVSLGISSRRIELKPGSRAPDVIELRVDSPIFGIIKGK